MERAIQPVGRKESEDLQYVKRSLAKAWEVLNEHEDLLQVQDETLQDHEARLGEVEHILSTITDRLDQLHDYKTMSVEQLYQVRGEIAFMLEIMTSLVNNAANTAGAQAARKLRTRILKNDAYAARSLKGKIAGGV